MYRTYTLYVNNQVRRIDDSQELAAEYAQAVGLGPKEALQLSLLIEETVGMLCAMAGDFEGDRRAGLGEGLRRDAGDRRERRVLRGLEADLGPGGAVAGRRDGPPPD